MTDNCKFTGNHRYQLEVQEVCTCCHHRRIARPITRLSVSLVPVALWANVILLLVLVFG